ncbi:MAG: ATP-dependent helicase [Porticoccaceae bacterium]|nr:MAG: ATP-dependent helicase [Porticoccaceae bacterium]
MARELDAVRDERLWEECLAADRRHLLKRWQTLERRRAAGLPHDRLERRLREEWAASRAKVAARRAAVPPLRYPEELPVSACRERILSCLADHQVVVIAGETGSGKTTQLPKMLLELGHGSRGWIGHTQPRRIAARTVAARLAEELGTPLGTLVGYQVRFVDQCPPEALIKVMTDGILLAEIRSDPLLSRYDALILDEAHERSLNVDFLLGYLKRLLPERPDLKLLITSATIDVERFSTHFGQAPVVRVEGRSWPVEIRYRPPAADEDLETALVAAVEELLAEVPRGDLLVFLPGEREIREASARLRRTLAPGVEVLPLYGRLSLAEQARIFAPGGRRRVVLATNVAETSLTVPGIRCVVDTGLARISRYSPTSKVQRLPVEPISRASADQRAGRCGRLGPGICVRLYAEEDYQDRPAHTDPEILRTNLAAVLLRMLDLELGEVADFPFLDPPEPRAVRDGFALLQELQAVDRRGRLTATGRVLARLSLDPRLGRTLVEASRLGALRQVLVIAAFLSIQDPREWPAEARARAEEVHRRFHDPHSDFVAILNLWEHLEERRQALSRRQFDEYCRAHFLSPRRVREWRDLVHQIHLEARAAGLVDNREPPDYAALHRALLAGFLSQVGTRAPGGRGEYLGTRGRRFRIFPGSGLARGNPPWVMAAEFVETGRVYAHWVARIEPEWIPPLAGHLLSRSHGEPRYDRRRGQVVADERQTLFGLTVADRIPVAYERIDSARAAEVFVRGCLVEGGYRGKGAFFAHNAAVLEELSELEDRLRRSDLVPSDEALYEFYRQRVPAAIANLAAFERWRVEAEARRPRLLFLDRERLLARAAKPQVEAQFPKALEWGGHQWRLRYRFEPGHPEDGVAVEIPLGLLPRVPEHRFEWLVPGLLREKCIALAKTLPKELRKQLVPVPDAIDRALDELEPDNRPLAECLARALRRALGVEIPPDAFREEQLADYYRMGYRLVDEGGELVEFSRDLAALKRRHRQRVQRAIAEAAEAGGERAGLRDWEFGELEEVRCLRRGGAEVAAYPALVDDGDSVSVRLLDDPLDAERASRRGAARLIALKLGAAARSLRKELLAGRELALAAAGLPAPDRLREEILLAACHAACLAERPLPRDRQTFHAALAQGRPRIAGLARQMAGAVECLLPRLKEVREAALRLEPHHSEAIADLRRELEWLFRPGFLFDTPGAWLERYPLYVEAAAARLEKLPGRAERDRLFRAQLAELEARARALAQRRGGLPAECRRALEELPFLLEELRISEYAQELRTACPVSAKRLARLLEKLEREAAGG